MLFSIALVHAVEQLLRDGEVPQTALAELKTGHKIGLWSYSKDNKRAIATGSLVKLQSSLPNEQETIAAIFSCEPECRQVWLCIIAARLKEIGHRRDSINLCLAIETISIASQAVLGVLSQASLAHTQYSELEMALFGTTAEQATATPKLFRIIGATGNLIEGNLGAIADSLADIDPLDPSINWVRGRLLRLPKIDELPPNKQTSILSGSWASLAKTEQNEIDNEAQATMRWVLARPWPFLLAQLVFTQEAWAAERTSSGVALVLDESQLASAYQPTQIKIIVTKTTGEEVVCGSLGELMILVLRNLGIELLTSKITASILDNLLAPTIRELLLRKVWRFVQGSSGISYPGYTIHETFSDSCYRTLGSRSFYRLGSHITKEIRIACERWADEKLGTRPSWPYALEDARKMRAFPNKGDNL